MEPISKVINHFLKEKKLISIYKFKDLVVVDGKIYINFHSTKTKLYEYNLVYNYLIEELMLYYPDSTYIKRLTTMKDANNLRKTAELIL